MALRRAIALTADRIHHKSHRAERGRRMRELSSSRSGDGMSQFSLWGGEGLGTWVRSPCGSTV